MNVISKNSFNSLKSNVYIKAGEVSELQKLRKKDTIRDEDRIRQTGMIEVNLIRNYEQPDKIKEIVEGYDQRGEKENLYFLSGVMK